MWPGGLVVFLIWVSYGVIQWRRSDRLLSRVNEIPERKRRAFATLLIFASAAFLLAGLYAIALLAPNQQTLNVLQWSAVGGLGLVFVHAQTIAAAMILSQTQFGVTNSGSSASTPGNPEG